MRALTVAAPRHSEVTNGSFARGLMIGGSLSVLLWLAVAGAVISLAGCQSYQPPGGELWRAV